MKNQVLLTFTDNTKIEAFLAFVADLNYIETAEILPNPEENNILEEPTPLYYTPKADYKVEEIEAIAQHFPKDYVWKADDIPKYFPQDLKISVQIIQNQLFIMASPNLTHQEISEELSFQIGTFIRKDKLGRLLYAPMDTRFDDDNLVQPDMLFIAVSRYHIIEKQGVNGAPDLVVEIWSPANKKKERDMKHKLYENHGVTEYWQIFPKKKKVVVEVLNEGGKYAIFSEAKKTGIIQSKVLEGFEMDITTLFSPTENE